MDLLSATQSAFTLRRRLGICCALILLAILIAGLWPFQRPRNDVQWLSDRNGTSFGSHGVVYSRGPRPFGPPVDADSCTLEIWLQPAKIQGVGTIVAFYDSVAPTDFSLFQERAGLGLRLHNQRNLNGPHYYDRVDKIFRLGTPVFVTMISNSKVTSVYADGVLAETLPNFPLVFANLREQLVAGTSAAGDARWAGDLLGIATYARMLTAAEVNRHYHLWMANDRSQLLAGAGLAALYLFDERAGRVIHNAAGTGGDLNIPVRYAIIHEPMLIFSRFHRADWSDVLLNIVGFAPLGFFFYAYLAWPRTSARLALATILLGAAISLTIEVLQAYLPDRTSDLRDVTMNSLGTALGVLAYQIRRKLVWLNWQ